MLANEAGALITLEQSRVVILLCQELRRVLVPANAERLTLSRGYLMKSVSQLHWDYFLLLERDLVKIAETLELSERNYHAYGPRIVQLILTAGSEIDVALKSLANAICPDDEAARKERPSMGDFKRMLVAHMDKDFFSSRVMFLRSDIVLIPWESLDMNPNGKIGWWDRYNSIKHRRSKNYERADLKTALELMGALFLVDSYLAKAENDDHLGSTQIIDHDWRDEMCNVFE